MRGGVRFSRLLAQKRAGFALGKGVGMAHILLDETEIEVAEDAEGALNRIVNARDGLRRGNGAIVAPPGWVSLTAADGSDIYVQVARIGYVREDYYG
jgi:hypothetical protein